MATIVMLEWRHPVQRHQFRAGASRVTSSHVTWAAKAEQRLTHAHTRRPWIILKHLKTSMQADSKIIIIQSLTRQATNITASTVNQRAYIMQNGSVLLSPCSFSNLVEARAETTTASSQPFLLMTFFTPTPFREQLVVWWVLTLTTLRGQPETV